jgi:4-hydroxybenzoate polyprenyltransferase
MIIAASAAATILYTPLLKPLPVIKNATVAAVIAAAPITGAFAAGAVRARWVALAAGALERPARGGGRAP